MSEGQEYVFLCSQHPQLQLVMNTGVPIVDKAVGAVVGHTPPRYVRFKHVAAGGLLRTTDPEEAEFVRNHVKTKEGKIEEISQSKLAEILKLGSPEKVKQGGMDTVNRQQQTAPKGSPEAAPGAAKTPRI